MEANINGFNVASNPCPFGSCDLVSQCSAKVNDGSALNYGSGSGYTIDTSKPYSVRTQFNAYKSADLTTADLQSIVTTLEQEGRSVSLTMDCPEYINELGLLLYYDMNLGISSYALDPSNEVSGGTCANVCASSTNFKIRDITFVANDSILEDPNDAGTPTYAEAAPLLDSGNCGSGCTECRKFYFSKTPEDWSYECVDTTHY